MANRERINELEAWLKVLRRCAACQVHFDLWDARASSFASAEEVATMRTEVEQSRRDQAGAEPAIEALIIKTRAEDPDALHAWISMHEAYEASPVWAELRSGARNLLYEFGAWPSDRERYVQIFGTDP